MTKFTSKDRMFSLIRQNILPANIVLDIGCGIRPQNLVRPFIHICADPHQEYLDYIRANVEPNSHSFFITLNLDWKNVIKTFSSGSVDTIFLLDVIEHLNKVEAKKLLKITQTIARKQVIIFTPYGFIEQNHEDDHDAWGLHGGKWQSHLSGWLPSDFGKGWDTYVVRKFHYTDNLGNKHSKPKGAMWAIYNSPTIIEPNPDKELNIELYNTSIKSHLGKLSILFIKIFKVLREFINLISKPEKKILP